MTAMRITKRIVDPITFQEFVGIEYVPRLEDTVLDDQLSGAMCFPAPSQPIHHPPPPPPPPPSSTPPPGTPSSLKDAKYRPPTPPKSRGNGPDDPNAPRSELMSPGGRRGSLFSPTGGRRNSLLSPAGLRKSLTMSPRTMNSPHSAAGRSSSRRSSSSALKEIVEDAELADLDLEGSISNLSDQLQTSLSKIGGPVIKEVRFADEVDMNEFSRAHLSMMDDLFYASEDLANFRYEAFMEEAGLDINDYD